MNRPTEEVREGQLAAVVVNILPQMLLGVVILPLKKGGESLSQRLFLDQLLGLTKHRASVAVLRIEKFRSLQLLCGRNILFVGDGCLGFGNELLGNLLRVPPDRKS